MGDPVSIGLLAGGLALSGGSIAAKQRAVKKAENKAAEAQAREAQRQREISQKAREKGLEALEEFDPEKFKKSEEEIVGRQLENVAKTLEKQPLPQSFKESSVPDVIVRESDKAKARGKKQASDFGESLARFGAQGLALQGANLRSKQTGFDVGRLARDSEISAMLAAQEVANARANTHSLFGEVLGGLGEFGMSAGISGAFAPTSKPMGAATSLSNKGKGSAFLGVMDSVGGKPTGFYRKVTPADVQNLSSAGHNRPIVGGGMVSDKRLKTNIKKVGEDPRGFGIYEWNYIWDNVKRVGVMAQELIDIIPDAVITMDNGFYAVDYSKI